MKNLARRIAALTPSITVALVLFTVGLTGLLAYRAFDASRAQRLQTERTLRDYAGFAAFQLKNATYSRLASQNRIVLDSVVRAISSRGPMPPLGVHSVAESVNWARSRCRCLDGVSFYYQVTFPDSAIESSDAPDATPANLRRIRDTVLAQATGPIREPPPPTVSNRPSLGTPVATQFFITIFSRLGDTPYVFAHVLTPDRRNRPLVSYGFAIPTERLVGDAVRFVLATQPVLPRTLTRGLAVDSILHVRVRDAWGQLVYANSDSIDARYAARDSLDARLGGLHFEIAVSPAAAGRLIIGGLPRSRLPEVLATAFVAVSLLGLLLYQFRRQEELGRLRDDFVSGVSHELRTPLAQIRLLAELLRMGKVPTEESRDRSLRIIDQEARRLSFLVDSILSFTRARQDASLSPTSTDVAAEIEETMEAFAPLARAHDVRLDARLQRDIVAEVDRGALRQVLINLLDNAVRYGPPGQTVTITTTSDGDAWTLEVADEGPGIPAGERERIFAPYYRMSRDAGGAAGGTGIGLAVVRRLVKQHGGRVTVAAMNDNGSRVSGAEKDGGGDGGSGSGARFVVTLPLASPAANGE